MSKAWQHKQLSLLCWLPYGFHKNKFRSAVWQTATHHQHQFCLRRSESNLWWLLHTGEVLFSVFHDDMNQEIKDLAITSCFQKDNLTRSFAQPLVIQSCALQIWLPFNHENKKNFPWSNIVSSSEAVCATQYNYTNRRLELQHISLMLPALKKQQLITYGLPLNRRENIAS